MELLHHHISEKYPTWVAVHDPYYSNQDPAQSVSVGESILDAYADVDAIICTTPPLCRVSARLRRTRV